MFFFIIIKNELHSSYQTNEQKPGAKKKKLSLKNKVQFPALDIPAAQNNKALNERSSTTLQSPGSAYFYPQISSVSLRLFILADGEFMREPSLLNQGTCLAYIAA